MNNKPGNWNIILKIEPIALSLLLVILIVSDCTLSSFKIISPNVLPFLLTIGKTMYIPTEVITKEIMAATCTITTSLAFNSTIKFESSI